MHRFVTLLYLITVLSFEQLLHLISRRRWDRRAVPLSALREKPSANFRKKYEQHTTQRTRHSLIIYKRASCEISPTALHTHTGRRDHTSDCCLLDQWRHYRYYARGAGGPFSGSFQPGLFSHTHIRDSAPQRGVLGLQPFQLLLKPHAPLLQHEAARVGLLSRKYSK